MKYIKVLEPIHLESLTKGLLYDDKGNPWYMDFFTFVLQRLTDPKFGKKFDGLISAVQIKEAVKKSGEYLELETKDWELLKDVVDDPSPSAQYNPEVSWCIVPFGKAILEAVDKLPQQ